MIPINKHTKLCSHMAQVSINDRPSFQTYYTCMLIGFSSDKILLLSVNVVQFQTITTLLAALSAGAKANFQWNLWTPFFKFLKLN